MEKEPAPLCVCAWHSDSHLVSQLRTPMTFILTPTECWTRVLVSRRLFIFCIKYCSYFYCDAFKWDKKTENKQRLTHFKRQRKNVNNLFWLKTIGWIIKNKNNKLVFSSRSVRDRHDSSVLLFRTYSIYGAHSNEGLAHRHFATYWQSHNEISWVCYRIQQ